jgi:hypothetical protein
MGALTEFLKDRILYAVIALGLSAGLIGAYGRERHEGREPNLDWWISRLCIIPFLGIVSSFAVDQFGLSNQQATFLSSVLSIMGYEAVRLILEHSREKGEAASRAIGGIVGGGKAKVRPYHSIVDVDDAGRPTAHVEPTDEKHPRRAAVGSALRQTFKPPAKDEVSAELEKFVIDDMGDIPGVG